MTAFSNYGTKKIKMNDKKKRMCMNQIDKVRKKIDLDKLLKLRSKNGRIIF